MCVCLFACFSPSLCASVPKPAGLIWAKTRSAAVKVRPMKLATFLLLFFSQLRFFLHVLHRQQRNVSAGAVPLLPPLLIHPWQNNNIPVPHRRTCIWFRNPQTSCIMHRPSACVLHEVHQTPALMARAPQSRGWSGGVTPQRSRPAVYYFCPPLASAT